MIEEMNMFKILVVDDDQSVNKSICTFLNRNDYQAAGCTNVTDALYKMYDESFDLVISDIMMPGTDGFEFAENIRQSDQNIPILFVSARDDLTAKQRGFMLGIDDYMTKPIDLEELLLRIRALLRRAKIIASKTITVGNLTMDADEHAAYVDGNDIELSVREFDILFKLLSYPKKTFSRTQLMNEFWDIAADAGTRTVDVYMTRIRNKTSACTGFEIKTVHGLGYKAVIRE